MLATKIFLLIIALQFCSEISANSIYRGNNGWQQPLQDFAVYHQNLQQQGYVPVSEFNPPFILHNNANHLGTTYGQQPQPQYHYQQNEYHHKRPHHPCNHEKTTTTTTTQKPPIVHPGKNKEMINENLVHKVEAVISSFKPPNPVRKSPFIQPIIPPIVTSPITSPIVTSPITSPIVDVKDIPNITKATIGNLVDSGILAIITPVDGIRDLTINILQSTPTLSEKVEDIRNVTSNLLPPFPPLTVKVNNTVTSLNSLLQATRATIDDLVDAGIVAVLRPVEGLKDITVNLLQLRPSVGGIVSQTAQTVENIADLGIAAVVRPISATAEIIDNTLGTGIRPVVDNTGDVLENVVDAGIATAFRPVSFVGNTVDRVVDRVTSQIATPVITKVENTVNNINNTIDNTASFLSNLIDNRLAAISNVNNRLFDTLTNRTSSVFAAINNRLESIENRLNSVRNKPKSDLENDFEENFDDMDMGRSIDDEKPESKILNIPNAIRNAQDTFNQVIENQVSRINGRINEIADRVDAVFDRLQSAIRGNGQKVASIEVNKPSSSVINWTPKSTTWSPPVTPEFFRFTVPDSFRKENVDEEDKLITAPPPAVDVESTLAKEMRNELQEIDEDEGDEDESTPKPVEYEDEDDNSEVVVDEELAKIGEIPLNDEDDGDSFDELEVIQLIPVIIKQLREDRVTLSERDTIESIFGNLWPLMVAEAARNENEGEMNPLLRTIFNSEEVRLAKRDITTQIGNDIYKNSIRRVYRGDDVSTSPYISLDNDRKLLSPSERLLNMVAAIVHKSNVAEKEQQLRKMKKMRHVRRRKGGERKKNPFGIVTVQKPKQQRFVDRILSANRMKRSLIKFSTDLDDMKALLAHVNHENEHNFDSSVNNRHDNDDYMDDDDDEDYDIDYEEPASSYSHDWYLRQRFYDDDYENGSVNEFVDRARQRDRREKTNSEWEQQQDFNDENDYDGEDYENYDEN